VPALILSVLEQQAAAQWARGRLRAAERAARQALTISGATHAASPAGLILAEVLYEQNQLTEAEDLARGCLQPGAVPALARAAVVLLARLAAARGQFDLADQLLAQREEISAGRAARDLLAAWQVRLWLWPGRGPEYRARALAWARRQAPPHPALAGEGSELSTLTLARVWLAQGQIRAVVRLLAEVRATAQAASRTGLLIACDVLEALSRQLLRQRARAFEAMWRALALAEPEGMVRVFADEGPAVARLLRRVPSHAPGLGAPGPSAGYVQMLIEACDPADGEPPAHPTGMLTLRELDVLRGVAQGQSNRQIADQLGMAVGTVNRHVHHVLAKLATHDRHGAVLEARRNGLL
jgi:LuxR family maltose regulon positive regulatory protein